MSNQPDLANALRLFRNTTGPIAACERASGGFSGAAVWRVQNDDGQLFAARRWPPGGLPSQRIVGLHRLLRHIGKACTVVAVPIEVAGAGTLVESQGCLWQLEPWLPGEPSIGLPDSANLSAAMRALAQWHRAAATFEPVRNCEEWFRCISSATSPAVTERIAIAESWSASRLDLLHRSIGPVVSDVNSLALELLSLARPALPLMHQRLTSFQCVVFRLQPCLRDVWREHVLFTGDEVTGIIDPSATRSENIATDLARLIGSYAFDDQGAWKFALTEYDRFAGLKDEEWQLAVVLDQSAVVLSPLQWLKRRYLDRSIDDLTPAFARLQMWRERLLRLAT